MTNNEMEPRLFEPPAREALEWRGGAKVYREVVKHDKYNMRLVQQDVERSDGTEGQQFIVDFPRQDVRVIPMDDKGNLYFTDEFNYAIGKRGIGAAGGTPELGDSLEETAIKEVREELGVAVRDVHKLGEFSEMGNRVNNISNVFLAKVESVGEAELESGEDIELKKVPFEDALDLVRNGEIHHAVVAAALWQINDLIERGEVSINGSKSSE